MKRSPWPLCWIILSAALAAQASPSAPAAIALSSCRVSGFEPPAAYEGFVLDAFTAELARFPSVRTLDRRSLVTQLKEIDLSLSGLVDSNSALEAGGLIGAAWILSAGLSNFGGTSCVLSAQLIDTVSGQVAYAAAEIVDGVALAPIQDRVKAVARAVAARLEPGAAPTVASLWVTDAPPSAGMVKPILIWVMSDEEDAKDPNGVWYLGPTQLKPLTDSLKEAGHAVVAQDRRSLPRLDGIDLAAYSQVWIIEGDGDASVDVSPGEAAALLRYYESGGNVWLSAENSLEPEASWMEDVNAFAQPFGANISGIVICKKPGLVTRGLSGPLFEEIEKLVYDDEIGIISFSDPGFTVLLEAPPDARLAQGPWTAASLGTYALAERIKDLPSRPNYSYGWLFGANFSRIGKPLGRGKAVMALRDQGAGGKGRLLIDSGWLIGWAFNGGQGRIEDVGQNVPFLLNVAAFLGGRLGPRERPSP